MIFVYLLLILLGSAIDLRVMFGLLEVLFLSCGSLFFCSIQDKESVFDFKFYLACFVKIVAIIFFGLGALSIYKIFNTWDVFEISIFLLRSGSQIFLKKHVGSMLFALLSFTIWLFLMLLLSFFYSGRINFESPMPTTWITFLVFTSVAPLTLVLFFFKLIHLVFDNFLTSFPVLVFWGSLLISVFLYTVFSFLYKISIKRALLCFSSFSLILLCLPLVCVDIIPAMGFAVMGSLLSFVCVSLLFWLADTLSFSSFNSTEDVGIFLTKLPPRVRIFAGFVLFLFYLSISNLPWTPIFWIRHCLFNFFVVSYPVLLTVSGLSSLLHILLMLATMRLGGSLWKIAFNWLRSFVFELIGYKKKKPFLVKEDPNVPSLPTPNNWFFIFRAILILFIYFFYFISLFYFIVNSIDFSALFGFFERFIRSAVGD